MDITQGQLLASNMNKRLIEHEKQILIEMKKWSIVEENTLRQKGRTIWIDHGDLNSRYFPAQ